MHKSFKPLHKAPLACQECGSEVEAIAAPCIRCGYSVKMQEIATESKAEGGRSLALIVRPKSHPEAQIGYPYVPVSNFRFLSFARAIYYDKSVTGETRFRLPALYGGELAHSEIYEALFVLQDPSEKATNEGWKVCETVEEAIEHHRSIFLDWAYERDSYQACLFQFFSPTREAFVQRFYVTDIWKDGKHDENYWFTKLRIELNEVRAERIIFASADAWKERELIGDKSTTPICHVWHPGWARRQGKTKEEYCNHIQERLQEC